MQKSHPGPSIHKLGTIECDLVETTPFVWQDRLYLLKYMRTQCRRNILGNSYFVLEDVQTGENGEPFAVGCHLGSALATKDEVCVFGVRQWGGDQILQFTTKDLNHWEMSVALDLPGWRLYNTSACKGDGRYILALEASKPLDLVGVKFTNFFAESLDLNRWNLLPPESHVYTKDRYSACPCLRYLDDRWYYMVYLEEFEGPCYESWLVRTHDFSTWQLSRFNPLMTFDDGDRVLGALHFTDAERERIATAININCSDVDMAEFQGQTHIYYSWGSQLGIEHLAKAIYPGPMDQLLKSFYSTV